MSPRHLERKRAGDLHVQRRKESIQEGHTNIHTETYTHRAGEGKTERGATDREAHV